jgi:FO synthase
MPHYGSPDKVPAVRIETLERAGEARVPFTTGILIGIGETRRERIESLLAIRDVHLRHGHIQEIIIQNFRAKPDTKMALAPEPNLDELLWTIAVARILFGAHMSVQAPPNLSPGVLPQIVAAGINDWGGVSPLTPDFVNPEAPWPHLDELARETAAAGKHLHERLTVYPAYVRDLERWVDPGLHERIVELVDAEGVPRVDDWCPGAPVPPPQDVLDAIRARPKQVSADLAAILERASAGEDLTEAEVVRLFAARGDDFSAVVQAADRVRQAVNGDTVSFVVNRNINYTNICYFKCQFCAFSKGKLSENLRGRPYDLSHEEIQRRTSEGWARGATEVCMQGGIHPEYTGDTYIDIVRAVKAAVPDMHVHAFSPLEVWQGAATLGLDLDTYLTRLKEAGLDTLPGTAAEILDDEVRQVICADKINTAQWLEVMEAAHRVGFRTTATIMYGHVERPEHWARHLLRIRTLQKKTGGFTEFVPLPFVHMEAPMYLKGRARKGPTFRESVLMHAVARLVLHPHITNIQASWVKLGHAGVKACLNAGCNDLGGTLMNESISRAAGTLHGQETSPEGMLEMIEYARRTPRQRTTLYQDASPERVKAGRGAPELLEIVNTPARKYERRRRGELLRPGLTQAVDACGAGLRRHHRRSLGPGCRHERQQQPGEDGQRGRCQQPQRGAHAPQLQHVADHRPSQGERAPEAEAGERVRRAPEVPRHPPIERIPKHHHADPTGNEERRACSKGAHGAQLIQAHVAGHRQQAHHRQGSRGADAVLHQMRPPARQRGQQRQHGPQVAERFQRDAPLLPELLQQPHRVERGEAPHAERQERQPQHQAVGQEVAADHPHVAQVLGLLEAHGWRLHEPQRQQQRQPAHQRLNPDHQVHGHQQQQAARHRGQGLGQRLRAVQPTDHLTLLAFATAQRILGVVDHGDVRPRDQAAGNAKRHFEQHQAPEAVGKDQRGVADAGQHGADQQRRPPADQVGGVARRHLGDQHHHGKDGLQQEDLLHVEALALKERHRDRHDHQEHLEEGQGQGGADVAFECSPLCLPVHGCLLCHCCRRSVGIFGSRNEKPRRPGALRGFSASLVASRNDYPLEPVPPRTKVTIR